MVNGDKMNDYPKNVAVDIVKNKLKLSGFIDTNKENIIDRLREFSVKPSLLNEDENIPEGVNCEDENIPEGVKFLSKILPFMSGIINVGTKPSDFIEAKNEVYRIYNKENGVNPCGSIIYILSVYTFIYIVENIEVESNLKQYLKKQLTWLCSMPRFNPNTQ